jgi:hypothetical protein
VCTEVVEEKIDSFVFGYCDCGEEVEEEGLEE